MKTTKKLSLKTIFTASGILILSLVLLLGGIFAIPKLAAFLRNNRVDEPNDESKNEIIERKELVYDGGEKYKQITLSYGSFEFILSEHFAVFNTDKPSSLDYRYGAQTLQKSDYIFFRRFPEGYIVNRLDMEPLEGGVKSRYNVSKDGKSYALLLVTQTTCSGLDFNLTTYKNGGYGAVADDWALWKVVDDGFFGVIIDEWKDTWKRSTLYVHDGKYMYTFRSDGLEKEDLVQLYYSFNPVWVDSSNIMTENDLGLPDNFKSYPIGLFNGYTERFKGVTLICDSENNFESSTPNSNYKVVMKEEPPSVFPLADGYEVYRLSDWEYIYKKDGLDAFKYTVSSVKYEFEGKTYSGTVNHTMRYSGSDAALFTVMVGKNEGFFFANGNYSALLWADGKNYYSLESYSADFGGVKLLALAESCEEREVLTKEYKSFYSNVYKIGDNREFKIDFRDNGNSFILCVNSFSTGYYSESVYVHMYDNLTDLPRATINETASGSFYPFNNKDKRVGIIYEIEISKEAFRLSDEMIITLGAKVLRCTYDGQKITVQE